MYKLKFDFSHVIVLDVNTNSKINRPIDNYNGVTISPEKLY